MPACGYGKTRTCRPGLRRTVGRPTDLAQGATDLACRPARSLSATACTSTVTASVCWPAATRARPRLTRAAMVSGWCGSRPASSHPPPLGSGLDLGLAARRLPALGQGVRRRLRWRGCRCQGCGRWWPRTGPSRRRQGQSVGDQVQVVHGRHAGWTGKGTGPHRAGPLPLFSSGRNESPNNGAGRTGSARQPCSPWGVAVWGRGHRGLTHILTAAGVCRSSGEFGQYPLMSATRFLYQRFPTSMISAPQ